jgi:hypothetical protein
MKTKMAALFATLMIALMVAGLAYAQWKETLYFSGTVKMGTVDAKFDPGQLWSSDDGSTNGGNDLGDNGIDSSFSKDGISDGEYWSVGRSAGKDVGATTATLSADGKTITITITNAYPDYQSAVHFGIKNTGSIPIKLNEIIDTSSSYVYDHCIIIDTHEGEVTNPGDVDLAVIGFWFESDATEDATYTISISFEMVQWNM